MTSTAGDRNMDAGEAGRLRWRCRRGMRELDVLLLRFLERDWPAASAAEREAFRWLLDRQDPDVHALLLGQMEPEDGVLAHVLESIRRHS